MWILSPLLLFKLLFKASISAKHEIISKCKAREHWLCCSQVSGWCCAPVVSFPLRSALPAQSCPQAFICWRHVEEDKRQICRNTAAEKSLSWDLHQTGTSEKETTDGICWTWCTWGRLFLVQDQLQQLKTPRSGYHSLLPCQITHLSPQPQDPCCALCPDLSWELSVHLSRAKAGFQAEQLVPITEPGPPEGQQYRRPSHSF